MRGAARACRVREDDAKDLVVIDAGMNTVRPALYGAHHEILPVVRDDAPFLRGRCRRTGVRASDVFAKAASCELREGELVAIAGAGAYGFRCRRATTPATRCSATTDGMSCANAKPWNRSCRARRFHRGSLENEDDQGDVRASRRIHRAVTPFDDRDRIGMAALERLVDLQIAQGIDGLVACGTTGESQHFRVSASSSSDGRRGRAWSCR